VMSARNMATARSREFTDTVCVRTLAEQEWERTPCSVSRG
jgi:hypothetical protein